jgi:tRNA pseudouridine55 synthase
VSDLVGILNIDKPQGWTSHDVVARVRRLAGQKRVGHAGTLDPLATGVLPVLLGRATRLMDLIQGGTKTYIAEVRLGAATSTDDTEGEIVAQAPVPPLASSTVEAALDRFRGEIAQTPPAYSAVKIGGRRAYALARAGQDVRIEPRRVTISDLRLLDLQPHGLRLEITCSSGTYIRALARDLALALATLGHLTKLVRTRVGGFCIDDAVTLDELDRSGVAPHVHSPACAAPDALTFQADADQTTRLANGQAIASTLRADAVWVYDPDGRVLCLALADGALLRPRIAL